MTSATWPEYRPLQKMMQSKVLYTKDGTCNCCTRGEKGERERESGEKDFLAHAQIYND